MAWRGSAIDDEKVKENEKSHGIPWLSRFDRFRILAWLTVA
jgi:hypothetical protein